MNNGKREITYCSNLYVNKNPMPIKVEVYMAPLKEGVSEVYIRKLLKRMKIDHYIVTHKKVYTTDETIFQDLNNFVKTKEVKLVTISNDNDEHSKVIGSLTYSSLSELFRSRGFVSISSKKENYRKVYYIPNNKLFEDKVEKEYATFRGIRGLMPRVYAGNVKGHIYIFFMSEGSYMIDVGNWEKFLKEEVKIRKRYIKKHKLNLSKHLILEKLLENEKAQIKDVVNNISIEVPLSEIYIPASTPILNKHDVLKYLYRFTSYKDDDTKTEYNFIESSLNKIFSHNTDNFSLKIGLTEVLFEKMLFKAEVSADEY